MESFWNVVGTVLPHVVWAGVLIGLIRLIGVDTIRSFLARTAKVTAFGVEVQLQETWEIAAERPGSKMDKSDAPRVARRLASARPALEGARILWVDDHPENNFIEGRTLETAGASVTFVTNSRDALERLKRQNWDLVLSDIARGNEPKAGLTFLVQARLIDRPVPFIFYVGSVDGPPPEGAFGITDRPDELMHLVVDALSRVRG